MKKTLRKKFIIFAMSAVTILLVVLTGAINAFSWIVLDRQSDDLLHTIAGGDDRFLQKDFRDRGPFLPSMNMDTVKSARFFMVHTDRYGNVRDVNVDQISSVTAEQAAQYAKQVTDNCGKVGVYKYEIRQLGPDRLIFFMDTSGQMQMFVMVLSISCAMVIICWIAILIFTILFSGRVVRPILAGMEKQKQFITNAGHELKTPLAIIQSNNDASALIHGETKYSKNIRVQTRRLNVLMANLLTLARLDEGAGLPAERVDISELTDGMLSDYEAVVAEKQLVLSRNVRPHIYLQVHRDTFSQMISILLDNAVKYTPEGGAICFSVTHESGHVEISEENTCEASDDSDPERFFERFYRGNSARTQDGTASGYGIGLSAARTIAETFGGKLTAAYPKAGVIRFTARFPSGFIPHP